MSTAPPPHWLVWLVPILLFLGGLVWGVTWYLVRRFIGKVDTLDEELAAVRSKLGNYLPREEFDMHSRELGEKVDALRHEGTAREDRILSAIRDHARTQTEETRLLRSEIQAANARVDRLRDFTPHGR